MYNVIGNGLTAIVGGYIVGNFDKTVGRAFFIGGAAVTLISAARLAYGVVTTGKVAGLLGAEQEIYGAEPELFGQAKPEELFGQAKPEELFGQARPEELFGAEPEIFGIQTSGMGTEDTIRPTAGIDALNLT